jgi:thioredoxin reductase
LSADIALIIGGPGELDADWRARLSQHSITVYEEPVARLEGTDDGFLQRIVFAGGRQTERHALFFNTGQHQRSPLAARLGCEFGDKGGVETREYDVATNVPGVYVAGDVSRDVQLVVVAVAEGTKAAFAINKALLAEAGLG